MSHWIALFLAILGNVGANASFKYFVQNGEFGLSWFHIRGLLGQPTLWTGGLFAITLLGCYLYAIRVLPISQAYTVATSLSIAGVTCVGVLMFGEALTLRMIAGILIILLGVYLVIGA